jgi:hypothetical protein
MRCFYIINTKYLILDDGMQRKIQINRKGIKNRTPDEKDSKSMTIILSFIIYNAIFTPNLFSAILTRYAANIFEPGSIYER